MVNDDMFILMKYKFKVLCKQSGFFYFEKKNENAKL